MGRAVVDAAFVNGHILTLDARSSVCTALAVRDGKIAATGDDAQIRALADASTEMVDLRGATVVPGINDAHVHAAYYGMSRPPLLLDCGFPAVRSIADIKAAVWAKAQEVRPGEWIRGTGWDEGYLEECLHDRSRHLTRDDLDEVAPDNPVCLSALTGHELAANTLAMDLAGITEETVAPPGSEIVRDPDTGRLSGLFREFPAEQLVMRAIPPWTRAEKRTAMLAALQAFSRRGITSYTEGGLGPGGQGFQGGALGPDCISVYNDLRAEGLLSVRVSFQYLLGSYGTISLSDLEDILPAIGIGTGFGDEWLRVAGVKLFADGIPQAKTAWFHNEYPEGGNGALVFEGDTDAERVRELRQLIGFAHRHGFQCGVHAIGDRATEACLDAFLAAEREEPRGLRHYLIHSDFITPRDVNRCAEHGVGLAAQPILKALFSDTMERCIGPELSARQFPLRELVDAGVHVSGSSDAPVVEPDWLLGIQSAVLRKSKASGVVRGAEQRVSVPEALRFYTLEGAWQDHMETRKGSLEPGKLADFCVLDQDLLAVPAEELGEIRTIATVVGGRFSHDEGVR